MTTLPEGVTRENESSVAAIMTRRRNGEATDDQSIAALCAAGLTLRQARALLRRQDRAFTPDIIPLD